MFVDQFELPNSYQNVVWEPCNTFCIWRDSLKHYAWIKICYHMANGLIDYHKWPVQISVS